MAISFLLLIIWLFSANNIIVLLGVDSENQLILVKENIYSSNSDVYTVITSELQKDDIFEQFTISGGAFCETTVDTSNRTVTIQLRSEKGIYEVPAIVTTRPDIYYKYADKKKIYNGNIGFQTDFSTLNLPNDIYELYIYVYENDSAYGITNTGYKYIKDKYGFRTYKYGDTISIPLPLEEVEKADIIFRLDNFSYNTQNQIHINGWQFLNSIESADTDVYLVIIDSQNNIQMAELKKYIRSDISNYYGNLYLISGIEATLNSNILLKPDTYTIKLIVHHDNNYYISNEYEEIVLTDTNEFVRNHVIS